MTNSQPGTNSASQLFFCDFASYDELQATNSLQGDYVANYLRFADAQGVIVEPNYFDRDYLAEFSEFYSKSARGYPNVCRRVHFFSEQVDRQRLLAVATGDEAQRLALNAAYLGFVVLRPLPFAPFGRTVLRWYEDRDLPGRMRVTAPSRDYRVHLVGIKLEVKGLAWQQQDEAVSTCATVALWTILHSSAFDDFHAIPTTTQITKAAAHRHPTGELAFPSTGLTTEQICEAIIAHELAPVLITGDVDKYFFTKGFLCRTVAEYVRSRYPVLLYGRQANDNQIGAYHTVCAVGFRDAGAPPPNGGAVQFADDHHEIFYINDDNIGPNVRHILTEDDRGYACLRPQAPHYADEAGHNRDIEQWTFIPELIIVATHTDMRLSPMILDALANYYAKEISDNLSSQINSSLTSVTVTRRFSKLSAYLADGLGKIPALSPAALAKARLDIAEKVPPLSLHVGVVRIGTTSNDEQGVKVLLDLIFDTSDAHRSLPRASVVFDQMMSDLMTEMNTITEGEAGIIVEAY